MSISSRIFAALYDPIMAQPQRHGLRDLRAELLSSARGRVLELGAGTGLNLEHYSDEVDELTLTEPEEPMVRRLQARVDGSGRAGVKVIEAGAGDLPVPDDSIDVVVSTLVLCTVPDVEAALAETRRVLVDGGRLLFLEHVRNPDARRARRQDLFNPVQRRIAAGCNCNRPTPKLIAAAGFTLQDLRSEPFRKAYPVLQPLAIGSATA